MANYRKRQSNGRRTSSLSSKWLFTGILLGILGTGFVYIIMTEGWPPPRFKRAWNALQLSEPDSSRGQPRAMNHARTQKKEPSQQFEFYTLLPGMEVPLPEPDERTKTQSVAKPKPIEPVTKPKSIVPVKTEPKSAKINYIVQAGLFRSLRKADELKARLILQGFNTHIQKIGAPDGAWFRVTLGPFNSETTALKQKKRLETQKVHSILVLQAR